MEEDEDLAGLRHEHPGLAHDVLGLRAPRIDLRVVVALDDVPRRRRPAGDAVDDDHALAHLALGHPVGDDVALPVRRPLPRQHQVIGVVCRVHADAAHHHIPGRPAEHRRPEGEGPHTDHGRSAEHAEDLAERYPPHE
jgi:hypothetical protein